MKKSTKQILFERMNKIGGMPLNENIHDIFDFKITEVEGGKYYQQSLKENEQFKEFDIVSDFTSGFARVRLNHKRNLINTKGEILSPNQWFDDGSRFEDGFAKVKLNHEMNLINTKGGLVSPHRWFDYLKKVNDTWFTILNLNGKQTYVKLD
jgi:hypothetical protein